MHDAADMFRGSGERIELARAASAVDGGIKLSGEALVSTLPRRVAKGLKHRSAGRPSNRATDPGSPTRALCALWVRGLKKERPTLSSGV
jgi:hypothetical protein